MDFREKAYESILPTVFHIDREIMVDRVEKALKEAYNLGIEKSGECSIENREQKALDCDCAEVMIRKLKEK